MPVRTLALAAPLLIGAAAIAQPFTVVENVTFDVTLNGTAFTGSARVTNYAGAAGWNGSAAVVVEWQAPFSPLPAPPWPVLAIMSNGCVGEPYLPGVAISDASAAHVSTTFGPWGTLEASYDYRAVGPGGLTVDVTVTGALTHAFAQDMFNPAGFSQRDASVSDWDFAAGTITGGVTLRWATASGATSLPCTFSGTFSGFTSEHTSVHGGASAFYSTCDPNTTLHFGSVSRSFEFRDACPADFNRDGFLDFFDYVDFVGCFEDSACPDGTTADFNADGFVDFFDYGDFVSAFESGC